MIQRFRPALAGLVVWTCALTAPRAGAATLSRAPFIQLVAHDSVLIAWSTAEASDGVVEYGLDESYGQTVSHTEAVTSHALRPGGLAPATRYVYRVSSGGAVLAEGKSFRTAPSPGSDAPFGFVVLGDSGGGTQAQFDIAARIAEAKPDFGLHIGDLVYTGKPSSELDHVYFDVYRDTIAGAAFFPALGNKDVEFDDGKAFLEAFHLPEDGSEPERYYSFVHGNALFIALDTNVDISPATQQHAWLKSKLAASTSLWKVVFFHHPMYGSGFGAAPHRAHLEPLFVEHKVDLVFQGHTHFYERTLPVKNGAPTDTSVGPEYVNPEGPVYFVTGGAGGTLVTTIPKSFSAHYESTYHFVSVGVEGSRLTLKAIGRDGQVIDTLTIIKDSSPPPKLFHRGDADENGQIQLTDAVRILNFLFVGAETPRCLEAADSDDNGEIQLTDAVRLLGFLFLGTEAPPPPGPPPGPCGPDPEGSPQLGCEAPDGCG